MKLVIFVVFSLCVLTHARPHIETVSNDRETRKRGIYEKGRQICGQTRGGTVSVKIFGPLSMPP